MAPNPFSLNGRVALVTGGNSGIGRTLALALREAGAKIAIGARRSDRNAAVPGELGETSPAFELDVCDELFPSTPYREWSSIWSHDILVNNLVALAAIGSGSRRNDWERIVRSTYRPVLCTKHAAKPDEGAGRQIINIAPVLPDCPRPVAFGPSCDRTHARRRAELMPLGGAGAAIAPGLFYGMTGDWRHLARGGDQGVRRRAAWATPRSWSGPASTLLQRPRSRQTKPAFGDAGICHRTV
jgi:NAD(P)-dependent dehydrogenase (short-subunit alcohol dehydrogenase family)